jgi:hypothetical protein
MRFVSNHRQDMPKGIAYSWAVNEYFITLWDEIDAP